MKAKLTIELNELVLKRATLYSKNVGMSLSDLIESYLKSIIEEDNVTTKHMNDDLKKMFGIAKVPVSLNHKEENRKRFY